MSLSRRDVLRAGTAAAALAAAGSTLHAAEAAAHAPASQAAAAAAPASQPLPVLPTRALGKTGAKVTSINIGCGGDITQRLLDRAYEIGIRYFDTADCYGKGKSEQEIAKWFERTGKRKDIFLVTKQDDDPEQMVTKLDTRLEALKTDYIDLYFSHGMDNPKPIESGQFKEVAKKLKDSGKVKFIGFSCHEKKAPELLTAAAECGYVDAIMFPYSPLLADDAQKLRKAMDACAKAGVGLIAMKTMRGIKKEAAGKTVGDLSIHQAVIKAVLSNETIVTICSAMGNFKTLDQNTGVARSFKKPMSDEEMSALRQTILAMGLDYCPGCDACHDGIAAAHPHVHQATRYLSYFEQDGQRYYDRELYRALPASIFSVPADALKAAKNACAFHVDYPALVQRAALRLA
jgi:predicted aldo/keto reductase-like oxidoreductase